jgi:predicted enzyme related to lactoylglutathione lyase
VPTRLYAVVFDAPDPSRLARFWATATGWPITHETPDEVDVEPPVDADGVPTEPGLFLTFVRNHDTKTVKNRVHIDLNTQSDDEYAAVVERVRAAGARPVDIGQGDDVSWEVFADPEGNELCVLRPRAAYADAGAIAAVVLDTPDPSAVAEFWAAATGRTPEAHDDGDVGLPPPDGRGPHLELLRVADPKVTKNRVHIDLAPSAADDQAAEVARLRALGATEVDVGQGDASWVVLADPHGNELCVLSPRD